MANERQFHVGVKAVIKNQRDQILLMKEDISNHSLPTSEYWDLPGGRIQEGEAVLDTLRREVEEETGITEISKPQFLSAVVSNHQIKLKNGEIVGLVLMIYTLEIPRNAKIVLSDEHLEYQWFDRPKATSLLEHKYPKEFTNTL